MKISNYLKPGDIIPELVASSKMEVLEELASKVIERNMSINREQLVAVLREREKLGSTGIGDGVALPHAKLQSAENIIVVFGRSIKGVPFESLDGKPAHLFFLLVAQGEQFSAHLRLLAHISRMLKNPQFRAQLLEAGDVEAIDRIIREQDEKS
jgi:PTS system nitrogen regulatory IIA component